MSRNGQVKRLWPAGGSVVTSRDVTQYEHEIASAESGSATDAAPALFTPDILLASQQAMARPPDSPCRRLVAAVLERGLLDAVGPTAKQPDRDDALAWFLSDDEEPFSFRWVALQLGMNPDWLRSMVRRAREVAGGATPAATQEPPESEASSAGGGQRAA
jgi:hypothetical protein